MFQVDRKWNLSTGDMYRISGFRVRNINSQNKKRRRINMLNGGPYGTCMRIRLKDLKSPVEVFYVM